MIPKEKAEELISNMYNTEYCGITHFPSKKYCDCSEMNIYQAKQCALIAVDEILHSLEYNTWQNREILKYYEEVKQEIEKL
jgi:hypothetical protein